MDAPRLSALRAGFADRFGMGPPDGVAAAPGRVNLIGDHTDYHEGFVLPMAIDREVVVAFRRRPDDRLVVHSHTVGETRVVDVNALEPGRVSGWVAYVAGVVWALRRDGMPVPGLNLLVDSNLPVAAGLSSSAALELAVARAAAEAAGAPWDPLVMARRAQHAEHVFAGVRCGIMDQLAAACGVDGAALLVDCRSLDRKAVPLPHGGTIVVLDTAVPRSLSSSAYNERRASGERAVEAARTLWPWVRTLRDVPADLLPKLRDLLDDTTFRRAAHVVAENGRPARLAAALTAGDLEAAGAILDESHASLRDLYEVSSPELELITAAARQAPGCVGARLTGAGFGGCALALVRTSETAAFIEAVEMAYRRTSGRPGRCFVVRPAAGARILA
jgi:galactokinase